jgi:hypothetical protein
MSAKFAGAVAMISLALSVPLSVASQNEMHPVHAKGSFEIGAQGKHTWTFDYSLQSPRGASS